jgi:RHS repeat-associated protein
MLRAILFSSLPLALLVGRPDPLAAQFTYCPTYIRITQYPTGSHNQKTAYVVVEYGDSTGDPVECFSEGSSPDPGTFRFYVNGVNRTSYFNAGYGQAVATALPVGNDDYSNSWRAQITGWDENLNPVTNRHTVLVATDWTPVASISPAPHEYGVLDPGRCAVDCFQATSSYSIAPYFILDAPQEVTLVYQSDWARPRPIVQMDVTPPTGMAGSPEKMQFKVRVNGTYQTFTNADALTYIQYQYTTQTVRLKGQFDASGFSTGTYPMEVEVGIYYGSPDSKWQWSSVATKITIVNMGGSRFGRGWSIAGFARLHEQTDGSALIVAGAGSAVYFHKPCGGCAFTTPNGAFGKLTVTGTSPNRTFRWAAPDSTRMFFNNAGYPDSVVDQHWNRWAYVYNGSDLSAIRDPFYGGAGSHEITFAYGAYGVSSITSQGARTTTVDVDGANLLWRIKAPNADSTKYTYDGSGLGYRLALVRDSRGFSTYLDYTSSWKLWKVTASAIDAYGLGSVQPQVVLSPWQDVGLPMGSTSTPVAAVTPSSITASVTDPESRTTTFAVDKWGAPVSVTNPLSTVTSILRDAVTGLPIRVTYPWGGKDSLQYDADGLPTMMQSTGKGTTRLRYGDYAEVDSVWGDVPPARYGIGSGGRIMWARYASNPANTVTYTHTGRGQMKTMQDPSGAVRRWGYDPNTGNTVADTLPGTRVTTLTQDSYGRVTQVARTGSPSRTLYLDVLNRIDSIADGVNAARTHLAYDGDFLTRVQDPKGQVYRFAHNALGWLTHRYDPADTVSRYDRYEYDRSGLVRRWTNRRNQPITLNYDALGRPTAKTGTNTVAEAWGYSSDFRKAVAVGEITRDSVFLSAGLLVDSTVTWFCEPTCTKRFRVHNTYNTLGQRTGVYPVSPTGIALTNRIYTYTGSTGTLASIQLGGQTTSFEYNTRLLAETTTFPGSSNSVSRTFTTVADRSRILAPAAYSGVVSRDIELDTLSRVRAQYRDDNNGVKFTYDGLSRLAVARYQYRLQGSCISDPDYGYECVDNILDYEETFSYDAAGNRTDLNGTYGSGNRVSSFDGWTVYQDLDGNDTSKVGNGSTYKFKWTAEGRLDSAYANSSWYHLRYGADGRLVGWDVDGTAASRLAWDKGNVLTELNGAITAKVGEYSHYPRGLDVPHLFITAAGAQHAVHRDGLGNVVATTDQGKNVVQQVTYETWGKEASVSQPGGYGQRFRWKGALSLQSELGLVYLRARWYDPDLAGFLTEDPIGLAGGLNIYSMGGGDPVNAVDPLGLSPCTDGEWGHWDDEQQQTEEPPTRPGGQPTVVITIIKTWHDCSSERQDYHDAFDAWRNDGGPPSQGGACSGAVVGGECLQVVELWFPPLGPQTARLLGRPFPTKPGAGGRLQPYHPGGGPQGGQYLPFSANPGFQGSPLYHFSAGFAQGVAAGGSGQGLPIAVSAAQSWGQAVGSVIGGILGSR